MKELKAAIEPLKKLAEFLNPIMEKNLKFSIRAKLISLPKLIKKLRML